MFRLITTLCVALTAQATVGQVAQRAVLYAGRGQTGEYIILPQTYAPDLAEYNFANRAYSACVTGTWIFYTERNYNTGANSGVEYVFGPSDFCTEFRTVAGFIRSTRFVGSPTDYRSDTLTLFQNTYFQGDEEYTFQDLPVLNLEGDHASIVITGVTPWTVFDRTNYQGNSICLYPPTSNNFTPLLLTDTTIAGVPRGTIKSVKRGCVGKPNSVSEFARFGEKV